MSVVQSGIESTVPTVPLQVPELMLVEQKLAEVLGKAEGIIKDTCAGLLSAGGKRIRPLLTVYSGLCFGPLNTNMVFAAVAAELVHMASLVHDDVIDGSQTRRARDTVNSLHGNSAAVLTGDYIFAEAFNILSSHKLFAPMGYLVEAIKAMCDGEVNQAGELFALSANPDKYFARIAQKTGILLAACCRSGAQTGGGSEKEIEVMGEYGLNLGYAFQIVDDILDFTGTQEKLGKPVGVDVTSGNITLPVILLMDNPVYGNWVKEVLATRQVSVTGVESIRQALLQAGSIEQSYAAAAGCVKRAKASLERIPAGRYKNILLGMADKVLQRQL